MNTFQARRVDIKPSNRPLPFQPKFDRDVVFRFHSGTVQQTGVETPLADRAYYGGEQEYRPVYRFYVRHSPVASYGGVHSYRFFRVI